MAKNLTLNENFWLLQAIYPNIFTLMANDGNFYVCLVRADPSDKYYKPYLEHPPENSTLSGIMRIFVRKEDASVYAQMIAQGEGLDLDLVKRWETPYAQILSFVREMADKHILLGLPGIRAVTTVIANDELVDADIFWTKEPEIMV